MLFNVLWAIGHLFFTLQLVYVILYSTNPRETATHARGCGFFRGCEIQTHTRTLPIRTCNPLQVHKPVTIPISSLLPGGFFI